MLEHDKIDVSEGIDVNKTNASRECDICHYWYIYVLSMNHIFAMDVLLQKAMNFNGVAIPSVNGSDLQNLFLVLEQK